MFSEKCSVKCSGMLQGDPKIGKYILSTCQTNCQICQTTPARLPTTCCSQQNQSYPAGHFCSGSASNKRPGALVVVTGTNATHPVSGCLWVACLPVTNTTLKRSLSLSLLGNASRCKLIYTQLLLGGGTWNPPPSSSKPD